MKKLLLLLLLLTSCSKPFDEEYWTKTGEALPISSVIEVEHIPSCGEMKETTFSTILGCTYRIENPGYAIIYINKYLRPELKKCVLSHEEAHAAGFMHKNIPTEFVRCGDGSMMRP
jgi:hypothetical protein